MKTFSEFITEAKSFYTENNLARFLTSEDTSVKVEKKGALITIFRFDAPSLVMSIKNNVISFSSDDFDNVNGIKTEELSDNDLEVVVMRNVKAASDEDIVSSDYVKNRMSLKIRR